MMKFRQLKDLKKEVKKSIDSVEGYLALVQLGDSIGVNSGENREETTKGRQAIVAGLAEQKETLSVCFGELLDKIDEAINKMS